YTGLTVTTNIALADWLMWLGSGSSYNVAYDSAGTPPYAPDYNLFTGLTLDLYVRFLELYLTGYGELALSGPYVGFDGSALGEDPARVKSFKFHYVFENTFNRVYQAREQYFYPGRYSWYWITWDFLD
ncbi:MAG: hypothetical protein ACE5GA_09690, partial [Candidatus Zixiibacteriota bacterium]